MPGRLERVGEHNGGLVVVDYAHKPDALAAVLNNPTYRQSVRQHRERLLEKFDLARSAQAYLAPVTGTPTAP